MAATPPFNFTSPLSPTLPRKYSLLPARPFPLALLHRMITNYGHSSTSKLSGNHHFSAPIARRITICKATEVSVAEESSASGDGRGENWVPVVPLGALPRGERRVIVQDGETILLLWYKDEVFAIENRSPAEGAYTEGLLNAKLTKFLAGELLPWSWSLNFDANGRNVPPGDYREYGLIASSEFLVIEC